jgi:hypothetical protein
MNGFEKSHLNGYRVDLWLHLARQLRRGSFQSAQHIGGMSVELYLQFGYGMMEHCRALIQLWGGGTVVLSPRDLSSRQILGLATAVRERKGVVLIDPQLYLPESDHPRLITHEFWPDEAEFWRTPATLNGVVASLLALNQSVSSREVILPGTLAKRVDDDWVSAQELIHEEAGRQNLAPASTFATVALTSDALRNDEQVERLLDAVEDWNVAGIYLVCEHPGTEYLIADPGWIGNCLDVISGCRLNNKKVVLGYCSHQMLVAAAAGANAVASGTWMNVRSFPASKFDAQDDDEIRKRSVWYYCPQALSEYTIPFLDVAEKVGVLGRLRTPTEYGSTFADELFTAPQPSLGNFTEQQAFRHYLHCLRAQAAVASRATYQETVDSHVLALDAAGSLLADLRKKGVTGQKRDFHEAVDANRAGLAVLEQLRGAVLRRKWPALINGA